MILIASVFMRTVSLGTCFSNGVAGLTTPTGSNSPDSPDSSNNQNRTYSADMHKIRPKNVIRLYKIRPKKGHFIHKIRQKNVQYKDLMRRREA